MGSSNFGLPDDGRVVCNFVTVEEKRYDGVLESRMRVLIVDDEPVHREYLAEVISGWKYEVGQAGNGEEALQLFNDTSFDIVLSDLMMPKMDGFELLRRLKAQGSLP